MKQTKTIFLLSLFTILTTNIFAVLISPEPVIQEEIDCQIDDVENQLEEAFQQLSISPKQHLENLRFVLRQPGIVENIYEFAFGKIDDSDQEKYDAIIQAIISSDDRDRISTVAILFSSKDMADYTLRKAIVQHQNSATIRSLCKISFFHNKLNTGYRRKTFLHLIAKKILFDQNTHDTIMTLIKLGLDVFSNNRKGLLPVEVASDEDIKQLLLREMRKQRYKYLSYKCKRLKQHCKKHWEKYLFICILPTAIIALTYFAIKLIIDLDQNECNQNDKECLNDPATMIWVTALLSTTDIVAILLETCAIVIWFQEHC